MRRLLIPFARATLTRALPTIVAATVLVAVTAAHGDEPPVPRGSVLRGTVESDGIREMPELKGARINRMRDESVKGTKVMDQTWQSDDSYDDVTRFYDRAFADALVIERDRAATATGWLVKLDDGTVASVTARNTRPTTIEIQRMVP